jgi:hypothetical protein
VTFVRFMFLFLGLWAGLQSSTPQATSTGTLRGIVRGPAGELASEVKVRIEDWYFDQGKPHFLTEIVLYTDQKGEFSVRVPAGVYDVMVSRPDCEPVAKKLKVVSGKDTIFKPELKISKLTEFIE